MDEELLTESNHQASCFCMTAAESACINKRNSHDGPKHAKASQAPTTRKPDREVKICAYLMFAGKPTKFVTDCGITKVSDHVQSNDPKWPDTFAETAYKLILEQCCKRKFPKRKVCKAQKILPLPPMYSPDYVQLGMKKIPMASKVLYKELLSLCQTKRSRGPKPQIKFSLIFNWRDYLNSMTPVARKVMLDKYEFLDFSDEEEEEDNEEGKEEEEDEGNSPGNAHSKGSPSGWQAIEETSDGEMAVAEHNNVGEHFDATSSLTSKPTNSLLHLCAVSIQLTISSCFFLPYHQSEKHSQKLVANPGSAASGIVEPAADQHRQLRSPEVFGTVFPGKKDWLNTLINDETPLLGTAKAAEKFCTGELLPDEAQPLVGHIDVLACRCRIGRLTLVFPLQNS